MEGLVHQQKHHPETALKQRVQLLHLSDQRLPTLFFRLPAIPDMSSFLQFRSCSNIQISAFIKKPLVHKTITHQLDRESLSFSETIWPPGPSRFASDHSLSISANTSCHLRSIWQWQCFQRTGPCPKIEQGAADWPGSRKGIGTRIGSLLNLPRNFTFLSLSLLLLLGHLFLKPGIEHHCNSKHISPFYGG